MPIKKKLCGLFLLFVSVCQVSAAIYGPDNRKNASQAEPALAEYSLSTVSIWSKKIVPYDEASGTYTLVTSSHGHEENLCDGAKFFDEPVGAAASGVLVGPDLVLAAGHTFKDETVCERIYFVFGYFITDSNSGAPKILTKNQVYTCSHIVKAISPSEQNRFSGEYGPDYAVIKLSKTVQGYSPRPISRSDSLRAGDKIALAGYPTGLPLKIVNDGQIIDASPNGFYVAEIDAFKGNSGSPILDPDTGFVQGIYVRGGDKDLRRTEQGCYIPAMLPPVGAGSHGVHITKPSAYQQLIPELK